MWLVPSWDYTHAPLVFLGASVIHCQRTMSGMLRSQEQEELPKSSSQANKQAWCTKISPTVAKGQESDVNTAEDVSHARVVTDQMRTFVISGQEYLFFPFIHLSFLSFLTENMLL